MENSDFVIFFDQIPAEGLERQIQLSPDDLRGLELSVSLEGPLDIQVTVNRLDRRILIRGTVAGRMNLECSRCLGMFTFPFAGPFEIFLEKSAPRESEAEKELSKEDLNVRPLRGGAVDLGEIIAEQVHLAVPFKALCGESCQGMCSRCGADLNVRGCSCSETGADPRWDALRDLKVR